MISVYLVVYMALSSVTVAPVILEPMQSMEDCLVKAEKMNNTDTLGIKRNKDALALGAEVACIKIVRDFV